MVNIGHKRIHINISIFGAKGTYIPNCNMAVRKVGILYYVCNMVIWSFACVTPKGEKTSYAIKSNARWGH